MIRKRESIGPAIYCQNSSWRQNSL